MSTSCNKTPADLQVMINKIQWTLTRDPDIVRLKHAKQSLKLIHSLVPRYGHFILYEPDSELLSDYLSEWAKDVLGGSPFKFIYNDGKKEHYGLFVKTTKDKIKFKNLIIQECGKVEER